MTPEAETFKQCTYFLKTIMSTFMGSTRYQSSLFII